MKPAYRMFKRKDRPNYYIQNNSTREQHCLGTSDKIEAKRLLDIKNQKNQSAALNLLLGKAYIAHADPKMATRKWQEAINELCTHGKEVSQARCARAFKATAFDIIRNKSIIETTSEDLKVVLRRGGSIANHYLRRLHNLALGNGWIQWHVIPPKQWPKAEKQPKRAITTDEHQKIIAAEKNEERRHYYEMLWTIGAAQTDCAMLSDKNINWETLVLSYERAKTGRTSSLEIGNSLRALLEKLPKQGFLFPKIAATNNKDRSAEFYRRCRLLGIKGVSLHSYRYSWAEHAYVSGYKERYAFAALGHKNRAVHYAYAKGAQVVCPPLERKEYTATQTVAKVELTEGEAMELSA
jgi:integrase